MHTFIYIIWFLLPTVFLLLALWAWLEKLGKSAKKQNPLDFLKQALFLGVCVGISVIIDSYFLQSLVDSLSPDFIPILFYQIMLLPIVLLITAKVLGGSKPILIKKAPTLNKRSGR